MKQGTYIYYLILLVLNVTACKNSSPDNRKPIVIGDPSTIVTETDSLYLQNTTEDISTPNRISSEKKISTMMVEVDSAKASRELEEEKKTPKALNGFTVNFAECNVTFDGMAAHAINANQNERASESVSYVLDAGQLLETMIEVDGLSNVKVEQRLFIKLAVESGGKVLVLNDLPKYTSAWFSLPAKDNRFVSVGSNSLQYESVDHAKIRAALEKELRKKKVAAPETKEWLNSISRVRTYSDAPCKLVLMSAQWRVSGKKDGRTIRKLIQFDKP